MRLVRVFLGLCFVLALGAACAHRGPALKAGSPVVVKEPIAIGELAAGPEKYVGQTVRLEGVVSRVCQGMGCWAEVKGADGSSFLARSLDESVLLPRDCAGKRIVVQGIVTELPAEAAAEPVPEGHECPRPTYLVATQGVELYE